MKVESKHLWTKSAYGRKKGIPKQLVQYRCNKGKVKLVEINGATLIHEKIND